MPKWFSIFPFHPAPQLSAADKAQLKAFFLKNAKPKDGKKAEAAADEKKPAN